MLDFLKTTAPWILVICGWWVVHYFTIQREKEKRQFDELKGIQKILDDIFTLSLKYHLNDERNQADEIKIIAQLTWFSEKIGLFFEIAAPSILSGIDPKEFETSIARLRMAITKDNFGGIFVQQDIDSALITEITIIRVKVVNALQAIGKKFLISQSPIQPRKLFTSSR